MPIHMATSTEEQRPLRINIIGAGIAGVAASIALHRLPNVKIRLFERSAVPREAGGWLGVTPNSETVLRNLVGDSIVDETAILSAPVNLCHWSTAEPMFPPPEKEERGNIHCTRRDLHGMLLVESEKIVRAEGGKKAVGARIEEGGVTLEFEDGEKVESDLLVVADGIRSRVRESLGLKGLVKYSGVVEYMDVFDRKIVEGVVGLEEGGGPKMFVNGKFWFWMSDVGRGRFGIIISTLEPAATAGDLEWAQDGGRARLELLRRLFAGWNPTVRGVLDRMQTISVFPVYRGEWLDDLTIGSRVALIGDAAHPTGGAYSAGAGLGLCDVQALCLALRHEQCDGTPSNLPRLERALKLYNATRAPLLQRVFKAIKADAVEREAVGAVEDDVERMELWSKGGEVDLKWLRFHDTSEAFDSALRSAISV